MKTFLAKTDPQSYSIEDFENEKVTLWDGVHNYQAINSIKNWQIGDIILIYQSMGKNDIASIGKVIDNPFLNTNDTRYSFACQIEHLVTIPLEQRINLKQIKNSGLFNDFALVRQSRLSVMECPDYFVQWLINNNSFFANFYSNLSK